MGKERAAETTRPERLYKYRDLQREEYARDIFINSRLYFASPSDFNDPFDCRVHFKRRKYSAREIREYLALGSGRFEKQPFTRRERDQLTPKGGRERLDLVAEREQSLQRDIDEEMSVLSLTARRDSILMWSHYSDNHTGFCLEFETGGGSIFDAALPVAYAKRLPQTDPFRNPGQLSKDTLLTKAEDWKYEEEWRILFPSKDQTERRRSFLPEALTGVIFGCRMHEDRKDKIRHWLRESSCQPRLYQAMVKTAEFGLDIVPE